MKLRNIFRWSQPELKKRLRSHLKQYGYKPISRDGFLYAKGELPVLLVAHLDTVHREPVHDIYYSKDGSQIWSPQGIGGDDRCGVNIILKIISELKCHVLFCEDEECGGIGATKFVQSGIRPNVNFIIELDRRGSNDAVFYDCDNYEFTDFVLSFGFEEKWGSFSDISEIAPALGIAAVNISSGYYNEHTLREYVDLEVMRQNTERVKEIIRCANVFYEYVESQYCGYGYWGWRESLITPYYNKYLSVIEANKIEDVCGYVITSDGEFLDSDLYIGSDNRIYFESSDGKFFSLENVRAFNASGGNLYFTEHSDTYTLYVE